LSAVFTASSQIPLAVASETFVNTATTRSFSGTKPKLDDTPCCPPLCSTSVQLYASCVTLKPYPFDVWRSIFIYGCHLFYQADTVISYRSPTLPLFVYNSPYFIISSSVARTPPPTS